MIRLCNLSVHLPAFSLKNIDFTIEKGEFFTLLGPTGSGKTLLLESIAGLVPLSKGVVEIQGKDVTRLPPEKRGVSIVYQDHALFPHMTVRRNILYGLRFHTHGKKTADMVKRAEHLARELGIYHLLDRFPSRLSGGERQRTALARALAVEPDILLLDEPLSSLDPNFREEIRLMIKKLHQETGVTVLLVTHDFTEAHFLSQRAAVLHAGFIEQSGPVQTVFYRPSTPFVADFVGMKNLFPAIVKDQEAIVNGLHLRTAGNKCRGQWIGIRPEHFRVHCTPGPVDGINCFEGKILHIHPQGFYAEIAVEAAGEIWRSVMLMNEVMQNDMSTGKPVFLTVPPEDVHVL